MVLEFRRFGMLASVTWARGSECVMEKTDHLVVNEKQNKKEQKAMSQHFPKDLSFLASLHLLNILQLPNKAKSWGPNLYHAVFFGGRAFKTQI